ncbi:unnamed protein product [Mucor circinelloides]
MATGFLAIFLICKPGLKAYGLYATLIEYQAKNLVVKYFCGVAIGAMWTLHEMLVPAYMSISGNLSATLQSDTEQWLLHDAFAISSLKGYF